MKPNFGDTSEDYARHRAGFPASLFERLAAHGVGGSYQLIVDLGTGTGSLARGFARRGCRVVGIDPAEEMLQAARRLDAAAGVSVEYRLARAEDTGLPDAAFDVVAAGQCWHWFDRPRAAEDAARILKREGTLTIVHFDWIPLAGNVARATEELIEHHNRAWKLGRGLGVHPAWLRDLGEAGYRGLETFSYDVDVPYTPEAHLPRGVDRSPYRTWKTPLLLTMRMRSRPGRRVELPSDGAAIVLTDDYNPTSFFDLHLKEQARRGILGDIYA